MIEVNLDNINDVLQDLQAQLQDNNKKLREIKDNNSNVAYSVETVLIRNGLVPEIIGRGEIIEKYSKKIYDKAIKSLRTYKTSEAKSAPVYLNRAEFVKWINEKYVSRTKNF